MGEKEDQPRGLVLALFVQFSGHERAERAGERILEITHADSLLRMDCRR